MIVTPDQKEIKVHIQMSEAYNYTGNVAFREGRFEEAYKLYSRAIKLDCGIAKYFTNRAAVCLNLQRWDLACADADKAICLDAGSIKGYLYKG